MKTVTEHLRARLYPSEQQHNYHELARTEWPPTFERLMRNRLILGAMRYAKLGDPNAPIWDTISSIIQRAEKYRDDGNQEHLVDIANLALVEFCRPSHPNPSFAPVDDGEHVEKL
jgi:hypothetical protein